MQLLLEDQTANTTGAQDVLDWNPSMSNGGKGAVYAFGTFDTCTITLEFSPDLGTTWIAVGTDTTFTAAGYANFEIYGIVQLRGSVTSVDTGTEVSLGVL